MPAPAPIPATTPIVDAEGLANLFFELRWEEVRSLGQVVAAAGELSRRSPSLNAALGATVIVTTREAGFYRVSYYIRKVVADGVNSSLTVSAHWVEAGAALNESFAALATDTSTAQQSGSKTVYADAGSDISIDVAYASNTPGAMRYTVDARVELVRI